MIKTVSFTLFAITTTNAFQTQHYFLSTQKNDVIPLSMSISNKDEKPKTHHDNLNRRTIIQTFSSAAATAAIFNPKPAMAEEDAVSRTFLQSYSDFTSMDDGAWQYKDVREGNKNSNVQVNEGDRVVFDWSGYTIGYFGRPFEAKGGPQGGAFDKELDYSRTVIGRHEIVPALESAFLSMKPGGIRQVIVPYGSLSYPPSDPKHEKVGPKPTTFSGQRALNFVLDNPRVDRTLLFNIKLIRVDKADGKGGFIRG